MARVFGPALALLTGAFSLGCEPATPCRNNSDCLLAEGDGGTRIGICSARGFCRTECRDDGDCPCGSFCAAGCGVCIRNDRAGPATCFGYDNFQSSGQLLGVCLVGVGPDGGPPSRPECPDDAPLPSCDRVDAGSDASDAGSSETDAGAANDAGGSEDAGSPDAAAPADAGSDDAGTDGG
ncbi:MAG TPA: hypothetical protein RMH99_16630 [Sandaracinaceae bacterium LLY-WYZ-13_1]|nr:hypothetical protein [Sandaracinaceae bacterium LLY-WYZ-13_1]